MELEELDRLQPKTSPTEGEVLDPIDIEDQAVIDIKEAILLFATVKTILDYVSDPELVRTISKRERENMTKVSEKVRRFLATIEPTYSEDDE